MIAENQNNQGLLVVQGIAVLVASLAPLVGMVQPVQPGVQQTRQVRELGTLEVDGPGGEHRNEAEQVPALDSDTTVAVDTEVVPCLVRAVLGIAELRVLHQVLAMVIQESPHQSEQSVLPKRQAEVQGQRYQKSVRHSGC